MHVRANSTVLHQRHNDIHVRIDTYGVEMTTAVDITANRSVHIVPKKSAI